MRGSTVYAPPKLVSLPVHLLVWTFSLVASGLWDVVKVHIVSLSLRNELLLTCAPPLLLSCLPGKAKARF